MAIVAVMMVVGFSAFKVADTLNDDPESGWYSISVPANSAPIVYNDVAEQTIEFLLNEGPSDGCDPENEITEPCAVYLDFSMYDGPSLTPTTKVSDVLSDHAKIDELAAGNDDGYARKDE